MLIDNMRIMAISVKLPAITIDFGGTNEAI